MFGLISWFILSFVAGLLTLWAVWSRQITRWRTVTVLGFLGWVLLSGGGLLLSQGWSSSCSLLLPGKYDIIGVLPVPEETIYIYLNTQYGPKTCHIPWDAKKSDELQKQIEGNGAELVVKWGPKSEEEGGGFGVPGFDESIAQPWAKPPSAPLPPKPPEEGAIF